MLWRINQAVALLKSRDARVMQRIKRVFFSVDQERYRGIYRELLAWLNQNDAPVEPWTTQDLTREAASDAPDIEHNRLVDHIVNSDYVMLLVGESSMDPEGLETKALNTAAWLKRPIVALNLNQSRSVDREHFPSLIDEQLVLHIPMEGQVIRHALETWRDEAFKLRSMGHGGPVHYPSEIYSLLERQSLPTHEFSPNPKTKNEPTTPTEDKSAWSHTAAA